MLKWHSEWLESFVFLIRIVALFNRRPAAPSFCPSLVVISSRLSPVSLLASLREEPRSWRVKSRGVRTKEWYARRCLARSILRTLRALHYTRVYYCPHNILVRMCVMHSSVLRISIFRFCIFVLLFSIFICTLNPNFLKPRCEKNSVINYDWLTLWHEPKNLSLIRTRVMNTNRLSSIRHFII